MDHLQPILYFSCRSEANQGSLGSFASNESYVPDPWY
jgi:hypothetical protein